MPEKPTFTELQNRIRKAMDQSGGSLPNDDAHVWAGYLAALLEWGLISVDDHARLLAMLPKAVAPATTRIFLGYETETKSDD